MHGGAADRSGLITVGDEVIEVNGTNVEGKTPNDVLRILVSGFFFFFFERDIFISTQLSSERNRKQNTFFGEK